MKLLPFIFLFLLVACQSDSEPNTAPDNTESAPTTPVTVSTLHPTNEVITLLGKRLKSPEVFPGQALDNYEAALTKLQEHPNDPEAMIWFGRRTAYLGYFQKAIVIFREGINRYPEDARFYRHRGHRFLSTRQYDKAIADFEKAVSLVEGQPDQIEPDGLPNEKNIPLTTLHGNIWYHLGLAYYLTDDLDNALRAFSNRSVTEKYDDNIVSGSHWLYMILRRQGNEAAAQEVLEKITTDMDIIENESYYKMCLFYKGELTMEDLQPAGESASADDVYQYGLGNWHLYHQQDTTQAKAAFQALLDNGNKYSFAYLAAEADWKRLFSK